MIALQHLHRYRGAAIASACALATTILSGCAATVLPDLREALPTHWRHPVPMASRPAPDLTGWWRRLDDPVLDRLVGQALRNNLDVAAAEERLKAERALYDRRDAPFMPLLHVRTDDPVDPDASASFFTLGFDARWELGLFGRRTGTQRVMQGQLEAASADLGQARVTLVAEVVRNWIDLRSAQHQARLLEGVRDDHRRILQLVKVRARLHLATAGEVAEATAAAAQATAAVETPSQEADRAAQRLALLLDRNEPDPAWLQPASLPRVAALDIDQVPADLLRTRPDVARAQAGVLRAAGALDIARADRYPDIGLGGTLEWSTAMLSHRDAPTNKIAAFGPLIDIPLFDWGLRQARAHARRHQLMASVLAYRKVVLSAVEEVEDALGTLHAQRRVEDASRQAEEALDGVLREQTARRRLGLSDDLALARARVSRDLARVSLVQAQASDDLAFVALYKALGGAPADGTPGATGPVTGSPR